MLNKKKALLILSPGFPPSESETDALAPVQMFIKALHDNNSDYSIHLIATQFPFEEKKYTWNKTHVYCLNGGNRKYLSRLFTWRKAHKTFHQIQQNYIVCGIISLWLSECFMIGERMSKQAKCKHFNWVLGQDGKPDNPWLKILRPKNYQLIAISKLIQEKLENYLKIKVQFIPGGFYSAAYNLKESNNKKYDFVNVGSLINLKNQLEFIMILNSLKNSGHVFSACIIGEGPLHNFLIEKIKEFNLNDCIELKGQIKHENVLEILTQSRCLVHTSKYEGNSTVISEALYCGALVLAYPFHFSGEHPNLNFCNNFNEMIPLANNILKEKRTGIFGRSEPDMTKSAKEFLKLFNERVQ